MTPVNIAQMKEAIVSAYRIMRPALALGSPGIGKSAGFAQSVSLLSDIYDEEVVFSDLRATLFDPVDLRGIPHVVKIIDHVEVTGEEGHTEADKDALYKTVWAQPVFLPTSGRGVLLIDELPTAPPLVQAALLQLILDRRLGEYVMPEGWLACGAGNKVTDRAGASKLSTALASRFVRLYVEADLDEWKIWARDNDIIRVIPNFLDWKSSLLHNFDPKLDDAFPCPRTWEFASDVLKDDEKHKLDPIVRLAMLEGCVGEAAAAELDGYIRLYQHLPAPEVFLKDPEHPLPSITEPLPGMDEPAGPGVLYALCGALADKAAPEHAKALFRVANRLDDEYSVLLVDNSLLMCEDLMATKEYINWSARHTHVL